MPVIRRGSTYLDVSTTPHTPEGRLKFDRLRAGCNIAYKKAICTTLLFICDENRDPHTGGLTDTLSMTMMDLRITMRRRAEAADLKLGPCKDAKLRPALLDLTLHRHIDLTFTEDGNDKSEIQRINIRPSFKEIYEGFQEVLDRCGLLSTRTKYRAYMSLAAKVFGSNRTPTLLQAVRCAVEFSKKCEGLERSSVRRDMQIVRNQHDDGITQRPQEHPLSVVHAGVQMDEDESLAVDQVNDIGETDINDTSMEPMWSEGPHDEDSSRQVVPITPIRSLNRNSSNREIGLPTPESLPRRNVVMSSSLASSDIVPSGDDNDSHSDSHNPQASSLGYISLGVGAIIGFVSGVIQGFEWSSDILLPEITSLHTEVINLQTSLAATEEALDEAEMATIESQEQCSDMLRDLVNAHSRIESLEACATVDAAEKCDLRQEVADLKREVSRLRDGVEQMRQIASVLIPVNAPAMV